MPPPGVWTVSGCTARRLLVAEEGLCGTLAEEEQEEEEEAQSTLGLMVLDGFRSAASWDSVLAFQDCVEGDPGVTLQLGGCLGAW